MSRILSIAGCGLVGLALALTGLVGCGAPHAPTASLSGTVTDDGKPFEGKIIFAPSGSSTDTKQIEVLIQGGKYQVPSLSVGAKAISVFNTAPPTDPNHPPNRQNGFWVAEPREIELKAGSQTIDFMVKKVAP